MNPVEHSILMANEFGGKLDDYNEINEFIDSTKYHYPHFLHRVFSHNSWFISIVVRIFGPYIINSDGNYVSVKTIAETHIKQDCNGIIPTIGTWIKLLTNKKEDFNEKLREISRPKQSELQKLMRLKSQLKPFKNAKENMETIQCINNNDTSDI